jgi:hypothetical protein
MPFPSEDVTPPVTNIYFVGPISGSFKNALMGYKVKIIKLINGNG